MPHYVYIIKSQTSGVYYKGYTENPERRLFEHNNNFGRYTKNKGPWILIFLKEFQNKKEALVYERMVKRAGSEHLQAIISRDNEI